MKAEDEYDYVNHPAHYKQFSVEVIDMMLRIWGWDAVINHCEMCAFKYKLRAGSKPGTSPEQDLAKADWYLNKANQYREDLSKLKDKLRT